MSFASRGTPGSHPHVPAGRCVVRAVDAPSATPVAGVPGFSDSFSLPVHLGVRRAGVPERLRPLVGGKVNVDLRAPLSVMLCSFAQGRARGTTFPLTTVWWRRPSTPTSRRGGWLERRVVLARNHAAVDGHRPLVVRRRQPPGVGRPGRQHQACNDNEIRRRGLRSLCVALTPARRSAIGGGNGVHPRERSCVRPIYIWGAAASLEPGRRFGWELLRRPGADGAAAPFTLRCARTVSRRRPPAARRAPPKRDDRAGHRQSRHRRQVRDESRTGRTPRSDCIRLNLPLQEGGLSA